MAIPYALPLPTDRTEQNFRTNVVEGIAASAGNAMISQAAILPLFVVHYTHEKWALGLVTAIWMLGLSLPQLAGAAYTKRAGDFWATFRFQTALPRLALVLLGLVPFLPEGFALAGFFVAFLLFSCAMGFNVPVWYDFISKVIPAERRGRFFGIRNALGGVASLGAISLASWFLTVAPHPWGFGACFWLAAVFMCLSWHCLLQTKHDWSDHETRRKEGPPFLAATRAIVVKHQTFRRYTLSRVVMASSTMATAFYVIYGMERFGLSAGQSSLLAIALTFLPGMAGLVWGTLADRHGNKRVQVPAALVAAVASLGLFLAPNLALYAVCLFLIGCANVTLMIVDSKWLMDIEPHQVGTVMSAFSLAMLPPTVLLSLGAGLVAQAVGLPVIFALSAAGWLLGGLLLAFWVNEPGRPSPESAA